MTMMLAPTRTAADEDETSDDAAKAERAKPQQKPAGSANPVDLDPNQI